MDNELLLIAKRLSKVQQKVLRMACTHGDVMRGCATQSHYGGRACTLRSLRRLGLLDAVDLATGQVLRTSDLTQAAFLGGGIGAYRPDGTVVATYNGTSIARYDATSLDALSPISTAGCGFTSGIQFKPLQRGAGWLVLGSGGTSLCKIEDSDFVFASEFD